MRALLSFLLLAAVVQAAPADHERKIVKEMNERYDFPVLTTFLKQVIHDHPVFEGVSLTATRIDASWRFEPVDPPRRMRNGDWVVWDQKDQEGHFDLYFKFDPTHSVTIEAKRLARDRFELVALSLDEWVKMQ